MKKRKWKLLIIIIISSMLLFFCLILSVKEEEYLYLDIFISEEEEIEVNFSKEQENLERTIFGVKEKENIFTLNMQKDFNGNNKYLFLPEFSDLSNVIVDLSFAENSKCEVLLDGILLKDYKEYKIGTLTEGLHSLTVNKIDNLFYIVKGSVLPSIWIETETGIDYINTSKENFTIGEIKILSEDGEIEYLGDFVNLSGRGNSSWYYKKKSYGIKLDEANQLLGMSPGKSWVLLGSAYDVTGIRNKIFLDMAEECGLENSVESEWADLYIDGKYYGCYLLTEKITVASGRLEIGDLEKKTEAINEFPLNAYGLYNKNEGISQKGYLIPNNPINIEGGYLLEVETYMDRYNAENCGFITTNGIPIVLKDPDYCSEAQIDYISSYVQEFEDALYSEDGYNSLGNSYLDYIDTESFAKRYLVDEFSKNIDAGYSSYFFYKPSNDSKIYAGPVWDYDTASGNNNGWGDTEVLKNPEGLYVNSSNWTAMLFEKKEFLFAAKEIYQTTFQAYLEELNEVRIEEYIDTVYESMMMDALYYERNNLDEEIDFLTEFMNQRKIYFDEIFMDDVVN